MFEKSADLYDLIYAQFKDYRLEAQKVQQLIGEHFPHAKDILDVGCGTAEHAFRLARTYGYQVDGIDIEPAFIELARKKHPQGTFTVANMTDFALKKRYDVILCLFSSIGYVDSVDALKKTLQCFKRHLKNGGFVAIEPWFEPAAMTEGRVFMHTAESDEVKVCRMSRTEIRDTKSILHFEYLVGRAEGLTRLHEEHEMTLFSKEQMVESFREAEIAVAYQAEGLNGRGMYLGRNP